MSTPSIDRASWLESIRTRVVVLALLVVALLVGAGLAFISVLGNRESVITEDTKNHLSSAALAMGREYVHENIQAQAPSPLENPDAQSADETLATVTIAMLQNERGVEGGFYSLRNDRLLGYAFPTHEGPGVKRDIPPIERPMIEDVARRAAKRSESVSYIYQGARDVIVFEAVPVVVQGNLQGSAWAMKRLPGLRSQGDLKISLGVAGFVLLSLACVLLALFVARDLGVGVIRIEDRLRQLDRDLASPPQNFVGVTELARIYRGINQLGESLRQKIEQERGLREQLRHKERLAALGQVAAGVAHELRNPLSTIRLRAQMTQRAVSDATLQQGCAMMLEEISRLDAMVERLLYFARPLNLNVERFDLGALARECVEARQALIRGDGDAIRIVYQPSDVTITVLGDRTKLRQVLDNVLSNAHEALDSGGTVEVRVRAENSFAVVECSDNGDGIAEEVRGKVFDPFFTTRANGTGLGLSIAYEIVQAHGGRIAISPLQPRGTIVSIHLPVNESFAADQFKSADEMETTSKTKGEA
jgi:signal transduction histidine kinase